MQLREGPIYAEGNAIRQRTDAAAERKCACVVFVAGAPATAVCSMQTPSPLTLSSVKSTSSANDPTREHYSVLQRLSLEQSI